MKVGNGVTEDYHDFVGTFEYWWTHGLISDDTYRDLRVTCDLQSSEHPSAECVKVLDAASKEQGNIDPYSIYTRPCTNATSLKRKIRGHYVSTLHPFAFFHLNMLFQGVFNLFLIAIH